MQVFVTGASGHIASAVILELIGAGHKVVGLARSDASAAAVEALGAEVTAVPSTISTACATTPPRQTASGPKSLRSRRGRRSTRRTK
jgi:nucleoside-diphosphate-sugar epimerase